MRAVIFNLASFSLNFRPNNISKFILLKWYKQYIFRLICTKTHSKSLYNNFNYPKFISMSHFNSYFISIIFPRTCFWSKQNEMLPLVHQYPHLDHLSMSLIVCHQIP
ncbi:hypothetical protein HanPI659440_Chr14g0555151 [Helianthus annuus]|nr:hypothetical protein HanPI659440_Chr14g0555151 [Helianthus annuus]